MNVRIYFCFLFAIVAVLLACTEADPLETSATESTSEGPPQSSFPDWPTSGGPASPTTTGSTGDGTTGTSTSTAGSTGGDPYCGDDVLDPGEECDLGRDNSKTGACTHLCKHATCGDGFLYDNFEECDLGLYNVGHYGGCKPTCELASYCGDGQLDVNFEQCDLGELNGTGVGEGDQPPCDSSCVWQARRVFITSESYPGDLGGLAGADDKCQSLAEAAGLADPENFRAWLSDGIDSPETRFQGVDVTGEPYILLSGRIVADSFADLTQNGPHTGISITETGASLFDQKVWTNTSAFGDLFSFSDHCSGWTSASGLLETRTGYNALAVEFGPDWQTWKNQRYWTTRANYKCYQLYRLYCFEDGPPGDG